MTLPILAVEVVKVSALNKDPSKHIYSVLPPGATRFLHLHCGSTSQSIECSLSTAQVTNTCPYEALSYVWGSEEDPKTLHLCGRKFKITQNLYSALRALRLPKQDRVLWVDALCINQGDETEKGTQIPLMGDIFKSALSVIAWLGSPTDDMKPGLRWLTSLAKNEDIINYHFPKEYSRSDIRKAIEPLLNNEYWRRAWIVQEIAFAKSLNLQCDNDSIPYEIFLKAAEIDSSIFATTLSPKSPRNQTTVLPPFRHKAIPLDSKIVGQLSVNTFLDQFVEKKCSDPRDSIFAFYNLFSPELQVCLPSPSTYSQDFQDLILKAIRAMIMCEKNLYAITTKSRQDVPVGEENRWQHGLPSWCPYVRTSFGIDSLNVLGKFNFGDEIAELSFQNEGKHLLVRGFAIAEVLKVAPPYRHRSRVSKDHKNYNEKEIYHILSHYCECLEFGLRIPDDPESPEGDSQNTSPFQSLRDGFMMTSSSTRKNKFWHIPPETQHRAMCWWWRTESRKLCKYTILREEVIFATNLIGWDDDDENWVDLGDAALIPEASDVGDVICGIVGCPLPVVLRAISQSNAGETIYKVIGEAFIGGFEVYMGKAARTSFILC